MQAKGVLLLYSAAFGRADVPSGVASLEQALAHLSPVKTSDWNRLSPKLQELLAEYPTVHQRELAKGVSGGGRFVMALAQSHGIGNRVNTVTVAFALALVTRRALIIQWDSRHRSCKSNATMLRKRLVRIRGVEDETCDPISIDDIFHEPHGIDWHGTSLASRYTDRKSCLRMDADVLRVWGIHGSEDVARYRRLHEANFSNFHEHVQFVCMHTDRPVFWGVTCNPTMRHIFPHPWATYGALQDYLLMPSQQIAERVSKSLDHGAKDCVAGIHLRKVKGNENGTDRDIVARLHEVFATRRSPSAAVFVAADPFSEGAKAYLDHVVLENGFQLITVETLAEHPTRSSVEGVLDAAAEATILGTCDMIIPFDSSYSTFHDTILGRIAWRQALDVPTVTRYINNKTSPSTDLSPPSSDCYTPPWHLGTPLLEEQSEPYRRRRQLPR